MSTFLFFVYVYFAVFRFLTTQILNDLCFVFYFCAVTRAMKEAIFIIMYTLGNRIPKLNLSRSGKFYTYYNEQY